MPRKTCCSGAGRSACRRFNEAAARCHGKHPAPAGVSRAKPGFNEAAARCHGKQGFCRRCACVYHASMRPRPDATENTITTEDPGSAFVLQ